MSAGSDRSFVYFVYPEVIALPAGVTATIMPMPKQNGVIFKLLSGSSLSVVGASMAGGSSFATSNAYLVGANEIQNIALSGPLTLLATGATAVIHIERLLSAP